MAAKHDIWDMWGSKGAEHVKINGSGLTSAWFSSNCKSIIHFYWNLSFSYSIDRGLKHFGKDFFGKHFRGLGHYFPPVFASSRGREGKNAFSPMAAGLSCFVRRDRIDWTRFNSIIFLASCGGTGGKFDFRAFPRQLLITQLYRLQLEYEQ